MKVTSTSAVGIIIVASMLLASNASTAEFSSKGIIHTVFLWLKKPGNEQHRQQLLLATDRLRTIPGVKDIRFGEVVESERAIVDDSFDVGIYFYFNDVAAMNNYLVHPRHRLVVEQDIKPLVQRIMVHDFQDTLIE